MLEVGRLGVPSARSLPGGRCGSGAHIRTAARLNLSLTAWASNSRNPQQSWAASTSPVGGLSGRVEIASGDIRDRTPDAQADLVTLHQNIYYFRESEQADLLRHLAGFLALSGRLLLTIIVRGSGRHGAHRRRLGFLVHHAGLQHRAVHLVRGLRQHRISLRGHVLQGGGQQVLPGAETRSASTRGPPPPRPRRCVTDCTPDRPRSRPAASNSRSRVGFAWSIRQG